MAVSRAVRLPDCPLRELPLYNVFLPCQHHMPSLCCSLRIPPRLTETKAKPWLRLITDAGAVQTLASTCPQI